jgi:hypothetical protein
MAQVRWEASQGATSDSSKKRLDTYGDHDKVTDMDTIETVREYLSRRSIKLCKVCFKTYDQTVGWQILSHTHQGQGPSGDRPGRD